MLIPELCRVIGAMRMYRGLAEFGKRKTNMYVLPPSTFYFYIVCVSYGPLCAL